MQSKTIIGQILSVGFIVYLVWILIGGTPSERLERTCAPVRWTENLTLSITALTAAAYQDNVKGTFKNLDYSCQYMFWRMFYEDDYKEALAKEQNGGGFNSGEFEAPVDEDPGNKQTAPETKLDATVDSELEKTDQSATGEEAQ